MFCYICYNVSLMQTNNKNIIRFILITAVAIVALVVISKDKDSDKRTDQFTVNQISTSTEVKIDSTQNKTNVATVATPNLDRLVIAESVQGSLREQITSQLKEVSGSLKSNTDAFDNWILLGSYRKIAGDYEGARDAWEYASAIRPLNYGSFSNLGDLYHYYLKDYPLAEKNLLISVKNKPENIAGYRDLYNLYAQSYKEKINEAPKILLSGLSKNPNNLDLLVLLAKHYAGAGDKVNAIKYYEIAITEAQKEGNTSLKQVLESELSDLK